MKNKKVSVNLQNEAHEYDIEIGHDLLDASGEWARKCLAPNTSKIALVSNVKVFPLYGAAVKNSLEKQGYEVLVYLMKDGEKHKNFRTLESILKFCSEQKLTRTDAEAKIQHRLDVAGNPPGWDVNRIIGLKVLGMGSFALIALLWSFGTAKSAGVVLLLTIGAGVFGYLLPNILLNNAGQKRENQMQNALPDALDLMTISVEAGLGFDAAVSRVAKETTGPLAQELARLLQEMQIGVGRMEAMRAMAERTTMTDLKSFCLAMVQADSFGIPVARVLRVQSKEMRSKRRQRAEEKAQQVPVKILFPLVFFILPALFVVILGPVVLETMDFFSSQQ